MIRGLATGALLVAAIVVAAIVFLGGEDDPKLRMVMPDSLGLREGSDVRIGGVSVGQVKKTELDEQDNVVIEAHLDDETVRIGPDSKVTIKSLNLLGEKLMSIEPGKRTPAEQPDVVEIPSRSVTRATDLDQLYNVLDADTRTRLSILINELGLMLTGRQADFAKLLRQLPPSLRKATSLVDDIASDNQRMASMIERSDRFLDRTVAQKDDLQGFIDSAASAAQTFAERDQALGATLARAPGGVAQLRRFLADLRQTAEPLGPAARNLAATAPQLTRTLARLDPFRDAAQPMLRQARLASPQLSRLGKRATPAIERSVPTLASLARFAKTAHPLTDLLGPRTQAWPDLISILEEWGQVIQVRDGVSHMFHGTFAGHGPINLQTYDASINGPGERGENGAPITQTGPRSRDVQAPRSTSAPAPGSGDKKVKNPVRDLTRGVQDLTGGLVGKPPQPQPQRPQRGGAPNSSLLDLLLKP